MSSPLWAGTFSTGDWSAYDGSPANNPDGYARDFGLVSSPVPAGYSHAFRATLDGGSASVMPGQPGERALLSLWPQDDPTIGKTRAYQGTDTWYRDMLYLPSSFTPSANTAWNWVYEIHNFPDDPCCANLAITIATDHSASAAGEQLALRVMGGGSPANPIDRGERDANTNPGAQVAWLGGPSPVQREHWYDLVMHVHWDWRSNSDGGQGFVAWYVDGVKVGTYTGPTLFYYASLSGPGQGYMQLGYYRPDDTTAGYVQPPATIYHAGTMIGPTAASVGENLS